ncbi:MAG: hypothetical protein LBF66_00760 [Holosporales bacterium]|jgi:hypothetical protein|nr:hypothetical protein [Holosporales bacterium]
MLGGNNAEGRTAASLLEVAFGPSTARGITRASAFSRCDAFIPARIALLMTIFAINGIPFSVFNFYKNNTPDVLRTDIVVANEVPVPRVFYVGKT